jgi:hypothetical protein
MAQNKKIYSILSVGIHEMSEAECLKWFPLLVESITQILDDKIEAEEKAARRGRLKGFIDKFR